MSRAGRRAYLDDYRPTADGSYAYGGGLWVWDGRAERATYLRWVAGLTAAAAALLLGAGLIYAPGLSSFAGVIVPHALALVGAALSLVSVAMLAREGDEVRDHVYQRHGQGLTARLFLGAAGSAVSVACAAWRLVSGGAAATAAGLGMAALLLGAAVCLALAFMRARKAPLTPILPA